MLMLDAYFLDYQSNRTKLQLDLVSGGSDYIRWIPVSKKECASLSCVDCRKSLIRCCSSDRCHGNCEYQDSLPDRHPQTRIQEWLE